VPPFFVLPARALLLLALGLVSTVAFAESSLPAEATVRLCEVPNVAIRNMVRFELLAREEVVGACDVTAPITLRIIFEDPLRGGFVEVRSGVRTLQTRLPGPLDTLDDRAVAVTAAALIEAVRAPPESRFEGEEPVSEGAPAPTLEELTEVEDTTTGEGTEPGVDQMQQTPPYISYLDTRQVVTLTVGLQNVGRNIAFAGGLGYGAMPSANIRIGIQVAFALGKAYAGHLDMRGSYVWHHGVWTADLGAQVVGSLQVFDIREGLDFGGGVGLHGGGTRYVSDHVGLHFGAEANGLYMRNSSSGENGVTLEITAWAGVRFGP
jgi:hypothetical protein